MQHVDFSYFNLSGHEIKVTDISGLPSAATPGYLVAVPDDTNQLNEVSAHLYESVQIADTMKIVWDENGVSREFKAKRDDLSIPSRLHSGKVRFTYLGDGKWRIRFTR